MKFTIASEHKHFFNKEKCIEFKNVISEESCEQILGEILKILQNKNENSLTFTHLSFSKKSIKEIVSQGYNLTANEDKLKKHPFQRRLATIVNELTDIKPLRLGFDQFVCGSISNGKENSYLEIKNLKDLSSVTEVVCGAVLCLQGIEDKERSIFAMQTGSVLFINPEAELPFTDLVTLPNYSYLLIVYTKDASVYILNDTDPNTHELKKHGYVFGDRVLDKTNPVILR
ncbi:hypothetical protein BN1013_00161 [Candidatus Rubidus massiliensis]|nr:MAG: hypothetical protein BGO10_07740 [Chlamydia sp. 32-24]CDZ79665.1 hypothetical protein BN1013_00161 [Candidatus Rubidus massiliensis]